MFEGKITVDIPGLEALAAAILRMGLPTTTPAPVLTSTAPMAPTAPIAPPAPVNPTAAPTGAPTPYQLPVTTATTSVPMTAPSNMPMAPMVPTAPAPTYTADQLQLAGGNLIRENQAKMPELLALLAQFGVPAITELTAEQMGPFATALRGLGGKL